jgi:hypothetical protein
MALSGRLDEIRERLGARQRELAELEAEAGIADAAETLRSKPESYDRTYEISHEENINRNLRKLYFSVRDVGLRRDLIRADQEGADTLRHFWRQHLSDAADRQKAARSANKFWWVWASICGAILIGLGFLFFGLVGALAGLLAGYLWSRQMEQGALRGRQRAIADADARLRYAEQTWKEARSEKQRFSQREAQTGEADSVSERPARPPL